MATAGAEPIAQLDTDLVRRALEGDNTAFDLLVVRYQRRIAALRGRAVEDDGYSRRIIAALAKLWG